MLIPIKFNIHGKQNITNCMLCCECHQTCGQKIFSLHQKFLNPLLYMLRKFHYIYHDMLTIYDKDMLHYIVIFMSTVTFTILK